MRLIILLMAAVCFAIAALKRKPSSKLPDLDWGWMGALLFVIAGLI